MVSGSDRGLRGGSWFSYGTSLLSAAVRSGYGPTNESDHIGFRVAMIPEPSTGLLVAAGLAGLTLRRRMRD